MIKITQKNSNNNIPSLDKSKKKNGFLNNTENDEEKMFITHFNNENGERKKDNVYYIAISI